MPKCTRWHILVVPLFLVPTLARAGAQHGGHHGGNPAPAHHGHGGGAGFGGRGGLFGGWNNYGSFYMTIGPSGPIVVNNFVPAFVPTFVPFLVADPGMLGGPMPRNPVPVRQVALVQEKVNLRKRDPAKAQSLMALGDRLFRAGNFKKATERFEQAVRADPNLASPRVRLAQVALVKGQYSEAAGLLRAGIAAEPGWIVNAHDIQNMYAEPADFTKQIAKLESHLLIEPGDRDAWLVLGAQLYLSGQTRRAGDIFVRLTDRKPDATLAAFLDASQAARAEK